MTRVSRAVHSLRRANREPCPQCGRNSITTSDGICADCWGSKGGRPMGWEKQPQRGDSSLEDVLGSLLLTWWW